MEVMRHVPMPTSPKSALNSESVFPLSGNAGKSSDRRRSQTRSPASSANSSVLSSASVDNKWASFDESDDQGEPNGAKSPDSERQNLLDDVDAASQADATSLADYDPYQIDSQSRQYYVSCFEKIQRSCGLPGLDANGVLEGANVAVLRFFESSHLTRDELQQVWSLADVNQDGYLTLEEFFIAMHLIVLRVKANYPIPDTLPSQLLPETPPRSSFVAASSSTAPQYSGSGGPMTVNVDNIGNHNLPSFASPNSSDSPRPRQFTSEAPDSGGISGGSGPGRGGPGLVLKPVPMKNARNNTGLPVGQHKIFSNQSVSAGMETYIKTDSAGGCGGNAAVIDSRDFPFHHGGVAGTDQPPSSHNQHSHHQNHRIPLAANHHGSNSKPHPGVPPLNSSSSQFGGSAGHQHEGLASGSTGLYSKSAGGISSEPHYTNLILTNSAGVKNKSPLELLSPKGGQPPPPPPPRPGQRHMRSASLDLTSKNSGTWATTDPSTGASVAVPNNCSTGSLTSGTGGGRQGGAQEYDGQHNRILPKPLLRNTETQTSLSTIESSKSNPGTAELDLMLDVDRSVDAVDGAGSNPTSTRLIASAASPMDPKTRCRTLAAANESLERRLATLTTARISLESRLSRPRKT